jgi:hypothetical protein
MFGAMKDRALSAGMKMVANTQMKEYGEMLKLDLDSTRKTIEAEVMLEGEKEPLKVKVGRYEMAERDGRYFLKIHAVTTSRAWLNTLAASYLDGREFEIPEQYAKMLKTIV